MKVDLPQVKKTSSNIMRQHSFIAFSTEARGKAKQDVENRRDVREERVQGQRNLKNRRYGRAW